MPTVYFMYDPIYILYYLENISYIILRFTYTECFIFPVIALIRIVNLYTLKTERKKEEARDYACARAIPVRGKSQAA